MGKHGYLFLHKNISSAPLPPPRRTSGGRYHSTAVVPAQTYDMMTTASLTTALLVSIPAAFLLLLTRRSKRSEGILIFRSIRCYTATSCALGRLNALAARRASVLPPCVLSMAMAVFMSGWCSLTADAVIVASAYKYPAGAESMTLGGLSAAWRWGRGRGKLASTDGASQRCVLQAPGMCVFAWGSQQLSLPCG